MSVLPLSVESVRAWGERVGDNVAGVSGSTRGCVVSRAAADILGVSCAVDLRASEGDAWGEIDGQRVQLPAFAVALALWLDTTDRLGRPRRRQVTGYQVVKQLARITA